MRAALIVGVFVWLLGAHGIGASAQAQEEYGWPDAAHESYWYSLYSVTALLDSGLGLLADGELYVPYASGDPAYVQSGSFEWSEAKADRTVTAQTVAWTILALSAQAKQLERLYERGALFLSEGALQRGTDFGLRAARAARFARDRLRDPQTGLYRARWSETGSSPPEEFRLGDQTAMLRAFAGLISLIESSAFYAGTVSAPEAELWAEDLFRVIRTFLEERSAEPSPYETGALIEALAAYAAVLEEGPALEGAVGLIVRHANALAERFAKTPQDAPLRDRARAVRALILAERLTGDESLRRRALEIWDEAQSLWDEEVGVYRPAPDAVDVYEYSVGDVADVVGAFAAVIYGAGRGDAKARYAQFFRNAVKRSRLMIAEGPEAGGDRDGDEVPAPASAGGRLGRAPVPMSKVQYDLKDRDWYPTNSRTDAAGAMRFAARLLWIGEREGQPYLGPPRYGLPTSREAQLIGLQMLVDRLRERQAPREELDALKELFISLENRFQEIQAQADDRDALRRELLHLRSQLADLEQRMGRELLQLRSELSARATAPRAAAGMPISSQDTTTVVLLIGLLLVGFVAYQWALQRLA